MRQMTTLELAYAIKHMRHLIGKHFSKFYWHGKKLFRMKVQNEQVFFALPYGLGICLYELTNVQEHPFVKFARKVLKNQILKGIFLYNFDRVVVFVFEHNLLICEFIGDGNLIITDKDWNILFALEYGEWSSRSIKKGLCYKPPPNMFYPEPNNIFSSEKFIISAMKSLNLGTKYHKKALSMCGIDERKKAKELSWEERSCIFNAIAKIISHSTPYISPDKRDFALFEMDGWERKGIFEIVNEIILLPNIQRNNEGVSDKTLEKLKKRLEYQLKALEEIKKKKEETKKAADFLSSNIHIVDYFIQKYKEVGIHNLERILKKEGFDVVVNKKDKKIVWNVNA